MIKKIVYGIVGLVVGLTIYSTLLFSMPKGNTLDVITDYNTNTESIDYAGREPIYFNTYHLYEDDIRYFESIDLVTYGKENPMWYYKKASYIPPIEDEIDDDDYYDDEFYQPPLGGVIGYDTESNDLVSVDTKAMDELVLSEGVLPVDKVFFEISSPYGTRKDPFTKNDSFHLGMDISSEYINGREIYSTLSGTVKFASNHNGLGNLVIVNHGEFDTLYGHLEAFAEGLKVGDKVKAGGLIGYVGSTGRSTGPHLHLEFDKDGVKIDPQRFIDVINTGRIPVEIDNSYEDEDEDFEDFEEEINEGDLNLFR